MEASSESEQRLAQDDAHRPTHQRPGRIHGVFRIPVSADPREQSYLPYRGILSWKGSTLIAKWISTSSPRQTATVSLAVYPQKLDFLGLNTFTPQPSTADFHQRGYQLYTQDRYMVGESDFLTSQVSYQRYDRRYHRAEQLALSINGGHD